MKTNRRRLFVAVGTLALGGPTLFSACSLESPPSEAIASLEQLPGTTSTTTTTAVTGSTTTTTSPREGECEDRGLETASFAPSVSDHWFVAQLREQGYMRVGLDENTPGFSARNREGDLEGFEVDLAHEIAKRVFGDSYSAQSVKPVPLVTSEKTDFVAQGDVDLTISATSMSCDRWEEVSFSAEYFTAHQEFLVRADSDIYDEQDLAGRTVCVTQRSSSLRIMAKHVPDAIRLPVAARTECLVALQNGTADAYFGHDSFLYGMLPQDDTVEIRPGILDSTVTVSHYGIAIHRDHEDFVRFVNLVLEDLIADGTWDQLVEKWLGSMLTSSLDLPTPPSPNYGRG